MKLEFEWDRAKAEANWSVQGVSFELAQKVFTDVFAVERLDDRDDYGEERFVIIGRAKERSNFICGLHRTRRAYSNYLSQKATPLEQKDYFEQNA